MKNFELKFGHCLSFFQTPRTESFKITRTENQNFLGDGKVELESTVSMTLQQKSIVHDNKLAEETAAAATTSVPSSGFQTPRVSSSIRFEDENSTTATTRDNDNNESSGDTFNFPSPPSPIQVPKSG